MPTTNSKHIVAVEVRADAKDIGRNMRRAAQSMDAMGTSAQRASTKVGAAMANIGSRVQRMRRQVQGGMLGRAGGAIKGALGFAGVFGFAQAIQQTRSFEAALTDIQITGQKSAVWLKSFRNQVLAVSDATGKSKEEVAGFAAAVTTQTGNVGLATAVLGDMAKASVATGASMGDLAQVFIKVQTAMGIKNTDAGRAFNILRGGELKGSFTMANVAQQIGGVGSAAAATLGKQSAGGLTGLQGLSALFQLTAKGVGADEPQTVKTAIKRFISRIGRGSKELTGLVGNDLRDESGQFKSLPDIIRIMSTALATDKGGTLLEKQGTKVFGEMGLKVAQQLRISGQQGLSTDTEQAASINTLLAAGTGSDDIIGRQFAMRMESPAQKLEVALNKISNTVQRRMLPALVKLADKMLMLIPVVKLIIDNFIAIGALMVALKASSFVKGFTSPLEGAAPGRFSPDFIGPSGRFSTGYRRFAGSSFGRNAGRIGAVSAAGNFLPSVSGSGLERGADVAATTAALAGGPVGAAVGAGYFAAKAVFTIAKATIFPAQLNFEKQKRRVDITNLAALIESGGQVASGGRKVSAGEQAEVNRVARELTGARRAKSLAEGAIFSGSGGAQRRKGLAALRAKLKTAAKDEAAGTGFGIKDEGLLEGSVSSASDYIQSFGATEDVVDPALLRLARGQGAAATAAEDILSGTTGNVRKALIAGEKIDRLTAVLDKMVTGGLTVRMDPDGSPASRLPPQQGAR